MLERGVERHAGASIDEAEATQLITEEERRVAEVIAEIDAFERVARADLAAGTAEAHEYVERARARLAAELLASLVLGLFGAMVILRGLRAPIVELTAMAERIAEGQHLRIGWSRRDELGELGRAIDTMSTGLRQRERELEKRSALISLDARLGEVLNQARDVRQASEGALRLIADELGAFAGALFVIEGPSGRFVAEATFGAVRGEVIAAGVGAQEGLLGEAVRSGRSFFIHPAPDEAPRFSIATADERGAAYLVYPIGQGTTVIGVMELACAVTPDAHLVGHLEAAVAQVGVALANALLARERDKLLARLEAQYAELEAREVTLRTQSETLDAQARELAKKNDELQAASRSKSHFIATMSHELRTPLNSILGFTELLLERSRTLSEDDRHTLLEVRAAGRHLLSVINDILDLARIGAGRLGLRRSSVALREIAREVLEVLRPQAQAKRIELASDVPAEFTVDADPSRLRQILLNLVGNAVKFTEEGTVSVRATPAPNGMRVEVVDTGPGIAQADHAKLFREFSQLENAGPRRHEGTGLGLAIARELVLAHGGEIGVDSELGRGSTFWFTLPRGGPAGSRSVPPPAMDRRRRASVRQSGRPPRPRRGRVTRGECACCSSRITRATRGSSSRCWPSMAT
jgi:signal transduction histidine kinase